MGDGSTITTRVPRRQENVRLWHSRPRARILSSVLGGIIYAGIVIQSGLFSPERRFAAASLVWRGAANGLLLALLVYFVLGPSVDRMGGRRRVGLADILAFCGSFGLLVACWWFSVPV